MGKLEVEVVSRETVKPSSPTPPELRHYKLSFLDQISHSVYNPLVLFYSGNSNTGTALDVAEISTRLKSSLSETLTRYYPLAGRLKNNRKVSCKDKGVPYKETRVRCCLSDVVQNPDPMELRKLIPFGISAHDDVCFGVQLNIFECGGVAVGICMSHKLGDGLSTLVLTRSWAAACRGDPNLVSPDFKSTTLFPPKYVPGFLGRVGITNKGIVGKRFVFGPDTIKALKERYTQGLDLQKERPPSRVEALSTFILSRFASLIQLLSKPGRKCYLLYAVNLRNKFEPPLPEHSFGNLYRFAMTFLPPEIEEACRDTIPAMREKLAGFDLERLKDGTEHMSFLKKAIKMYAKGELIGLSFTSLCRFPLYEADFGWGNPVWVGLPASTFNNVVVFADTKSGDGVEAYFHLKEEDMAKLEKDEEFQKYITPSA